VDIQAVVFDFGKVICCDPGNEPFEKIAGMAGLELKEFAPLLWSYRTGYDRGVISGEEYYRTALSEAGVCPADDIIKKMLETDLESWTRINPLTVALMQDVKKAGLKLGILSNMPHDFLAMARKRFPVFQLCDAGVFSCDVNSVKPEEPIYRAVLSALGCRADEAVFFDDMPVNVEKALALGFKGYVWESPENARQELRRLSIAL
jgi:putative hydrolase of the HAD superfamily